MNNHSYYLGRIVGVIKLQQEFGGDTAEAYNQIVALVIRATGECGQVPPRPPLLSNVDTGPEPGLNTGIVAAIKKKNTGD